MVMVKHATYTGSRYVEALLAEGNGLVARVVKVMPREYKRALAEQAKKAAQAAGRHVVLTEVSVKVAEGASVH
jgi:glutamate synthase domain-containing protein 3